VLRPKVIILQETAKTRFLAQNITGYLGKKERFLCFLPELI
jgi:hypothetical protein